VPHRQSPSYTTPKVEKKQIAEKGGWGVFAREFIAKGELLTISSGEIVHESQLNEIPDERLQHGYQVEEEFYIVPLIDGDIADCYNHSCNPNIGWDGQLILVAMRDIQPGEELCFDYAMSDSTPYDEFECHCGEPHCRRRITGDDWRIPALQKRYKGYFLPYLQHRIDRINAERKAEQHDAHEPVPARSHRH